MVTTTTRSGRQHHNQTSSVPHQHPHHARRPAASDPPALEQLLLFEKASPTQHGGFENEWHWARDTQLREDAHRYRETMNAVRLDGFWSITLGLAALAHDSRGLLLLLGWGEPPQAQNSA
jgi:hypothetical protein